MNKSNALSHEISNNNRAFMRAIHHITSAMGYFVEALALYIPKGLLSNKMTSECKV